MNPTIAALARRLMGWKEIRALAESRYELTGKPKDLVRRDEVTGYVAEALRQNLSPQFRRRVRVALEGADWRAVNHGGVGLWKGVRRRPGT